MLGCAFGSFNGPPLLLRLDRGFSPIEPMIEIEKVVEVLAAYRKYLQRRGQLAKAAAVTHCIALVRQLGK